MKIIYFFMFIGAIVLLLATPDSSQAICYEEKGEKIYVWDPIKRTYGYQYVTYEVPVPCDEEELNKENCYFETQSLITSAGDPVVEEVFVCDE